MILLEKDNLRVKIYPSRKEMGREAALDAATYIKGLLEIKETLNIIFAAAPSQNEFLGSLLEHDIRWERINAFHMDEYIGLPEDAPQGFGNFLNEKIFLKAPFRSVNLLRDTTGDAETACATYEEKLRRDPVDIVFMGIGENGHIAFNDPHVADFNDEKLVKIVDLDIKCRQQQVNDGCFSSLDLVPTHAITLTIPALTRADRIFCIVPAATKAEALKNCIEGPVTHLCPASVLRLHNNTTLYADSDSASKLDLNTKIYEESDNYIVAGVGGDSL